MRLSLVLSRLSVGICLFLAAASIVPQQNGATQSPDPTKLASVFLSEPRGSSENWAYPLLDRNSLRQRGGVELGSATVSAGYTRELIRFEWRAGDPLDVYVLRPKGTSKPPVVLYLYGYPSETDRFRDDGWCSRATEGGFAAVGFVSAFTGDRYHARPMKEWFVSELQEALGESTHDVQLILDYLGERGDLDMSRVGMFGQGSGGAVAILAAGVDPRIRVVDVLNPWGDWPDWIKNSPLIPNDERPNLMTPAFLRKVQKLDPLEYLPNLKLKGLRVQELDTEVITPPEVKAKLAGATPVGDRVFYKDEASQMASYRNTNGLWNWIKGKLQETSKQGGTKH